jgi:UDP-N-acetylglucosamine:LPS N-acetylglucosamine transferase
MKRVVIVSARVGAGHDGAAHQLARRCRDRGMAVDVVDVLDMLPGPLGRLLCDGYRRQLTVAPRTWDWLLAGLDRPALAATARWFARLAGRRLAEVLDDSVAFVMSTYPLATHAIAHLKARGRVIAPLVVYLTDPSVHRLCVSPLADLTIAPNDTAARQAHDLGARRTIVARPLVGNGFRPVAAATERDQLRAELDLPRDRPLALIVAGSWGVGEVEETAADVTASGQAEPVVVCGENDTLRARLTDAGYRHVFGWVTAMPELMRACDVVVQNAGGLTTSEALASGLPVVTYRCLPGHGRSNAAVLDADGTVPWLRTPADLAPGLARALATARLPVETAS